jgi:hypothetical protein
MRTDAEKSAIASLVLQLSEEYEKQVPDEAVDLLERRQYPRRPFDGVLEIAFGNGQEPSKRASFKEVLCRDICAGGFSFWSDCQPGCDEFIVKLRVDAEPIFFQARLIHAARNHDPSGPTFVIGCEFSSRLDCIHRPVEADTGKTIDDQNSYSPVD